LPIQQADLHSVTGHAWQMLTGLESAPLASPLELDCQTVAFRRSVVGVRGAWAAEVCVFCPPELATMVASAMFMMDAAELTDADIDDALGELCNVTAGGIQSRIPGETDLTVPEHLPSVVSIDGTPHWRADLMVEGLPVVVTVSQLEV